MIGWLIIAALVGGMTWFFCAVSIFLVKALHVWIEKGEK